MPYGDDNGEGKEATHRIQNRRSLTPRIKNIGKERRRPAKRFTPKANGTGLKKSGAVKEQLPST